MLSKTMIQTSKILKKPIDTIEILTKKTPEESYTDEEIQKIIELGFDGKKLQEI